MDRNQIKVLIRQMTLEEKAGQVTQLPSRYFAIQGSQLTGTETKLGIRRRIWKEADYRFR